MDAYIAGLYSGITAPNVDTGACGLVQTAISYIGLISVNGLTTGKPGRHSPNRLQDNVIAVQKLTLLLAPLFPMPVLAHVGHVASQDRVHSRLISRSGGFKPGKDILIHAQRNCPFCHWEDKRRLIPKVIWKFREFSRCPARNLRIRNSSQKREIRPSSAGLIDFACNSGHITFSLSDCFVGRR